VGLGRKVDGSHMVREGIFLCVYSGIRTWTQGLSLCHLSHAPNLFWGGYFLNSLACLCPGRPRLWSYFYFPISLGWQVHATVPSFFTGWDEVSWVFYPSWLWTTPILLIIASWVARIIAVSHGT
jgi:hypothetical protein